MAGVAMDAWLSFVSSSVKLGPEAEDNKGPLSRQGLRKATTMTEGKRGVVRFDEIQRMPRQTATYQVIFVFDDLIP